MRRFSLLPLLAFCVQLIPTNMTADELETNSTPVVAAYYENWSQYRTNTGGRKVFWPNLIDPTILTDVHFAFAIFGFVTKSVNPNNPHLTGDYTVQPVEWNDQTVLYPQVAALKQKNPNLRNILSIGGWSFNDPNDPNHIGTYTYKLFSQMVATQANRTQFINSAIAYAQKYGFDGLDLDWEYPGDLTRGGTEDDFANFIELLKELYAACKAQSSPLYLTYASAAIVPNGVSQKWHDQPDLYFQWLAECAQYLDRLNIMCYDFHGAFDNPMITGVNAPLNSDTNPTSTFYDAKTVQNYLAGGVPANKMVLGMPTYGHTFGGVSSLTPTDNGPGKPFTSAGAAGPATGQPGFLSYFEICDMNAQKKFNFGTDATTSTVYGYNTGTQEWVSYDTPDTIAEKAQLAKDNNLLGVMFWAVDNDEYQWGTPYPNIRSGYQTFYPSNELLSKEEFDSAIEYADTDEED